MSDFRPEWHNDAAHGWLKVTHREIEALNITGISSFSYRDKTFAYLEEDCDAGKWFEAMLSAYPDTFTKQSLIESIPDVNDGNMSPIRRKEQYCAPRDYTKR